MKIDWSKDSERILSLIQNNVSYEEIGREYGVTGSYIRKLCKQNGYQLTPRRGINVNEHFNRGIKKSGYNICLNCGKEIEKTRKFCSVQCQVDYKNKCYIEDWQNGVIKISAEYVPKTIKKFLLEKVDYKCELCGFEGYNQKTGNTILQIHHKDGDSSNNHMTNLQVLCPNCHALTENYSNIGGHKSSRVRYDSKEYHLKKFKSEFGIINKNI